MQVVELPYLYEATLARPRHRIGSPYLVRDAAAFSLPEAAVSDAPLVLEWRRGDTAGPLAMRWRDGRLYAPLSRPGAPGCWEPDRFPRQVRPIHAGGGPQAAPVHKTLAETLESIIALNGDDGAVRVVRDDRSASIATAAATYARFLLVVDGDVWTSHAIHEPWWAVVEGEAVEVEVGASPVPRWNSNRFRADRRADALLFAHLLAGPGRPVRVTPNELVVHRPDLLCGDDAMRIAEQMLSHNAPLRGRSGSDGDAMRALALLRSEPGRDVEWAARVLFAAEPLADVVEGSSGHHDAIRFMDPALRRWVGFERGRRPDVVAAGCGDDAGLAAFQP